MSTLSPYQISILQMISDGRTHQEIAERLNKKKKYIQDKMESVRVFLGAYNTVHAVAIGLREGIIK